MAENNKIISFVRTQKRKKAEYKLESEISVYICRKNESYIVNWFSRNELIGQEKIYVILKKIFEDLSKDVEKIQIKKFDNFEVNFSILYYERPNNIKDFKYIFIPQNIEKEKLIEYLFININIYELKKAGVL